MFSIAATAAASFDSPQPLSNTDDPSSKQHRTRIASPIFERTRPRLRITSLSVRQQRAGNHKATGQTQNGSTAGCGATQSRANFNLHNTERLRAENEPQTKKARQLRMNAVSGPAGVSRGHWNRTSGLHDASSARGRTQLRYHKSTKMVLLWYFTTLQVVNAISRVAHINPPASRLKSDARLTKEISPERSRNLNSRIERNSSTFDEYLARLDEQDC